MNLNQVTIPSLDLAQSIPFYEKLGLTLIVKSMPHYARFVCPDGDATFSIHLVKQLPKIDGVTVYFETEHLEEQVKRLQNEGVIFEQPLTSQPWLWQETVLRDPDQNKIILYHAGEMRKNPPWKIKS